MTDTVILLSGGLDSTVLLASALADGRSPMCLSVRYGAEHGAAELAAAGAVAAHYGVPHRTVDVASVFVGIVGASCPVGGYSPAYTPNRNAVFLSLAVAVAEAQGAPQVWFGAHRDDHRGFPDCRPAFVEAFDQVAQAGTATRVRVLAPFVALNKSAIVRKGVELAAPLHLTHTCYRGTNPACGECSACYGRMFAFRQAKKYDPATYAANAPLQPEAAPSLPTSGE